VPRKEGRGVVFGGTAGTARKIRENGAVAVRLRGERTEREEGLEEEEE
jgi:hypothetical protein